MAIDTLDSTAVIDTATALSDGSYNATLTVTIVDTLGDPIPNCQVQVRPMGGGGMALVQHEHVNAYDDTKRVTYTDASGVAEFPLAAVTGLEESVTYLVYAAEDTPDTIEYTEHGDFLAGRRGKPDGLGGYIVGPVSGLPGQGGTEASAVTIDDTWLMANGSRIVRNKIFRETVTLSYTIDANNPVQFANCTFDSTGNYSIVTNGKTFTLVNCQVLGSLLAGIWGEGGTVVRSVLGPVGRDAFAVEQGSTVTPSRFFQVHFRDLGTSGTRGYAMRGTPMRNVVADHCWFDLDAADVLAPIRNETVVGGSRGPSIIACWISGGTEAQVAALTGASTPEYLRVRACRFTLGSASAYIDNDSVAAPEFIQGNMDDATGVLIDNAVHAGANVTAGPVEMWPEAALAAQPVLMWTRVGSGGGPGGPGTGEPPGEGSGENLGTNYLYSVTEMLAEPVGGGAGNHVVRPTRITGEVLSAEPILLGDIGSPTLNPYVVNWAETTAVMAEGSSIVVIARLTPPAFPAVPDRDRSVPIVLAYGTGAMENEITVPATVFFAAGAQLAQVRIDSVDDGSIESAENTTLRLQSVFEEDESGSLVEVVTPGGNATLVVTVIDNDTTGPTTVYFGVINQPVDEPLMPPLQQIVNIPLRVGADPTEQVVVHVATSGTATLGVDYRIDTTVSGTAVPGSPGVYAYVFQPGAPLEQSVPVVVFGDTVLGEPNETVILTATVASGPGVVSPSENVCTVTIRDLTSPPAAPPRVRWQSNNSLVLHEGTTTNYVATFGSYPGDNPFGVYTQVRVQIRDITAVYTSGDFRFRYNDQPVTFEPNTSPPVMLLGIPAGERYGALTILVNNDQEDEDPERFELEILPPLTGTAYEVDTSAGRHKLYVELLDPEQSNTEVFVERIPLLADSIVSCVVPVLPGVADTTTGWRMTLGAPGSAVPSSDCQWYPVSYKPDGTPSDVFLWGYLPGGTPSTPGNASSVRVLPGNTGAYTAAPISVEAQRGDLFTGDTLRLSLYHNVNGENREFSLPIAGNATKLFWPGTADRQGSASVGQRDDLYGRLRAMGELSADNSPGSDPTADKCTVARVYLDFRADVNAVRLTVNWRNARWDVPTSNDGFKSASPYVDGEVFFDSLSLEGIRAGWDAVVADARTAVSSYVPGSGRVDIIKSLGATARHFIPPLRGHVAYILLYKQTGTGAITTTQANAILNQWDVGYAFGTLGLDKNDVLGEMGVPVYNYGDATPLFTYSPSPGVSLSGWPAVTSAGQASLSHAQTRISQGQDDLYAGQVQRGWWLPWADPDASATGGQRINISAGSHPCRSKRQLAMLDLVHVTHRMGMDVWKRDGTPATDEDYCKLNGNSKRRTCTSLWVDQGAGQMWPHQFFVPDTLGVLAPLQMGPGRRRARASIVISATPNAGDTITITDHTGGNARVLHFENAPLPANTTTTTYIDRADPVTRDERHLPSIQKSIIAAVLGWSNSTTFPVHPMRGYFAEPGTVVFRYRFQGTVGNDATIATNAPTRISVATFSGGTNTSTLGGLRLWNYIEPGPNSCDQDIYNNWHTRGSTSETAFPNVVADYAYHIFDWPHMARANTMTRDGWWLYLDPAAHDVINGLMHLGTQSMTRYLEGREDISPYLGNGSTVSSLLFNSTAAAGLAHIREGLDGRYAMEYILRDFDGPTYQGVRSAAVFGDRVRDSGGFHTGTWLVRHAAVAKSLDEPYLSDTQFNLANRSHYLWPAGLRMGRDWAWLLASVARGYCTSPAHRPIATMNGERDNLHPPAGTPADPAGRVSWFDLLRTVMRDVVPVSGATAVTESQGDGYTALAPSNFYLREGNNPGGPVNNVIVPWEPGKDAQSEWYPTTKTFQANYMALAVYSILKRVYSWVDAGTTPASNPWLTDVGRVMRYMTLVLRCAKAGWGQARHFWISDYNCYNVGNPANRGNPQGGADPSSGIYGFWNDDGTTETASNPWLHVNAGEIFWWANWYTRDRTLADNWAPIQFYRYEYMMSSWIQWRVDNLNREMVDDHAGLIDVGPGPIDLAAGRIVDSASVQWATARRESPDPQTGDSYSWLIQWHRNDFP